jgi:hypothetical protein
MPGSTPTAVPSVTANAQARWGPGERSRPGARSSIGIHGPGPEPAASSPAGSDCCRTRAKDCGVGTRDSSAKRPSRTDGADRTRGRSAELPAAITNPAARPEVQDGSGRERQRHGAGLRIDAGPGPRRTSRAATTAVNARPARTNGGAGRHGDPPSSRPVPSFRRMSARASSRRRIARRPRRQCRATARSSAWCRDRTRPWPRRVLPGARGPHRESRRTTSDRQFSNSTATPCSRSVGASTPDSRSALEIPSAQLRLQLRGNSARR